MNTDTVTTTPAQRTRSTRRVAAATTAATIAIVGICGAAVFAFAPSSHASSAPQAGSGSHSGSSSQNYQPTHKGSHGGSSVKPSASIKALQKKLGALDYYEGPIDGIDGPQTTAAIKDLQRDAHLPQTGVMNQATSNALAKMLISGNNVMAAK